jgi:hypothetical protein
MNDYDDYENDYIQLDSSLADEPLFLSTDDAALHQADVDFDDEKIAALPRIILMGPRRGGKTSIQVRQYTMRTTRTKYQRFWQSKISLSMQRPSRGLCFRKCPRMKLCLGWKLPKGWRRH